MVVLLQSIEGDRFSLSEAAARQSGFIEQILSAAEDFGGPETPNAIECRIHSTILRMVRQHLSISSDPVSEGEQDAAESLDLLNLDDVVLVDLLVAADYLDIPGLFRVVSTRIHQILTADIAESSEGRKAMLIGRIMGSTSISIVDIWNTIAPV
jgi:hypothetical protein